MGLLQGLENELSLALHAVAGVIEKQPALAAEVIRIAAHALAQSAPAATAVIEDVAAVVEKA